LLNADSPWPFLIGRHYWLESNYHGHFGNPDWSFPNIAFEVPDWDHTGVLDMVSGPHAWNGHTIEFGYRVTVAQLNAQVYGGCYVTCDGVPAVIPRFFPRAGFDYRGQTMIWNQNGEIILPGVNPADFLSVRFLRRKWSEWP